MYRRECKSLKWNPLIGNGPPGVFKNQHSVVSQQTKKKKKSYIKNINAQGGILFEEFNDFVTWNRTVKHDPVQDMEVE